MVNAQAQNREGSILLQWLNEQEMQVPAQDMPHPTYHPYNRLRQPRRLGYIFLLEIEEVGEGKVHQLRHLASSDHDAVTVQVRIPREQALARNHDPPANHGARQLRGEESVNKALRRSKTWRGDGLVPTSERSPLTTKLHGISKAALKFHVKWGGSGSS